MSGQTKAELRDELATLQHNFRIVESNYEDARAGIEYAEQQLVALRTEYNGLLEDVQVVVEEFTELWDTCAMEANVAGELALSCFDEGSSAERFASLYEHLVEMEDDLKGSDLWRKPGAVVARHERLHRISERKKWESGE